MNLRSAVATLVRTACFVLFVSLTPLAGQLASVQIGRYHHFKTAVEFPVPAGWSVVTTGQSSDGGEQTYLRDAALPGTYVAVWMKKETNTVAEADAWLELAVKMKVDQTGWRSHGLPLPARQHPACVHPEP
jgi:hypothetical protein